MTTAGWAERLGPHLRGHAFLFEAKPEAAYGSSSGLRLLLVFLLLEGVLGPRLSLLSLLRVPIPPSWLRVPVLLGFALMLVRFFARLQLSQIGLYPWRDWSRTEKSYFVQVFLLANVVFSVLFVDRLQGAFAERSSWGGAAVVLLTCFVWGFYQELMYRGILQTELVRRFRPLLGILVSNCLSRSAHSTSITFPRRLRTRSRCSWGSSR